MSYAETTSNFCSLAHGTPRVVWGWQTQASLADFPGHFGVLVVSERCLLVVLCCFECTLSFSASSCFPWWLWSPSPVSTVFGRWRGDGKHNPCFVWGRSRSLCREGPSAVPTHYKLCNCGGVACFESCLESSRTTSGVPTGSMAGDGNRWARPETRGHLFSIAIFIFQSILRYGCGGVDFGSIALHVTSL